MGVWLAGIIVCQEMFHSARVMMSGARRVKADVHLYLAWVYFYILVRALKVLRDFWLTISEIM